MTSASDGQQLLRRSLLLPPPPRLHVQEPGATKWDSDDENSTLSPISPALVETGSPSWISLLNPRTEVPRISVKASAFSLISTMVGGGCLSIPFAFQEAGLVLGIVILLGLAYMTFISLELIVSCSRRCEKHEPSYSDVAFEAIGPLGRYITSSLILLMTFFATVACIILEAEILPYLFSLISGHALDSVWYTQKEKIMIMVGILVFPIITVRRLSALRFSSAISLVSVAFLAICMCIRSLKIDTRQNESMKMVRSGMRLFLSFSVLSVSFVCHFNILPVHFELRRPTRKRISRLVRLSIISSTMVYLLLGISGYYSFSGHVLDNILNNYSETDILISCGRFGLSITLICSAALISLPTRDLIDETLFPGRAWSRLRAISEAAAIVSSAVFVASRIPRIVELWSFIGSTLASITMFVLPATFYLRLRKKPVLSDRKSIVAFALGVFGIVIGILCTIDSLRNTIWGAPTD